MPTTAPGLPGTDFYDQAKGYFERAAEYAIPGQTQIDTAANRIRSRMAGAQQGVESQIGDKWAGRGFSNSGMYGEDLSKSRGQYIGALQTGLATNEADFSKRQQEGATTLSGIGKNIGDLGVGRMDVENTRVNNERQRIIDAFIAAGQYGGLGIGGPGALRDNITRFLDMIYPGASNGIFPDYPRTGTPTP